MGTPIRYKVVAVVQAKPTWFSWATNGARNSVCAFVRCAIAPFSAAARYINTRVVRPLCRPRNQRRILSTLQLANLIIIYLTLRSLGATATDTEDNNDDMAPNNDPLLWTMLEGILDIIGPMAITAIMRRLHESPANYDDGGNYTGPCRVLNTFIFSENDTFGQLIGPVTVLTHYMSPSPSLPYPFNMVAPVMLCLFQQRSTTSTRPMNASIACLFIQAAEDPTSVSLPNILAFISLLRTLMPRNQLTALEEELTKAFQASNDTVRTLAATIFERTNLYNPDQTLPVEVLNIFIKNSEIRNALTSLQRDPSPANKRFLQILSRVIKEQQSPLERRLESIDAVLAKMQRALPITEVPLASQFYLNYLLYQGANSRGSHPVYRLLLNMFIQSMDLTPWSLETNAPLEVDWHFCTVLVVSLCIADLLRDRRPGRPHQEVWAETIVTTTMLILTAPHAVLPLYDGVRYCLGMGNDPDSRLYLLGRNMYPVNELWVPLVLMACIHFGLFEVTAHLQRHPPESVAGQTLCRMLNAYSFFPLLVLAEGCLEPLTGGTAYLVPFTLSALVERFMFNNQHQAHNVLAGLMREYTHYYHDTRMAVVPAGDYYTAEQVEAFIRWTHLFRLATALSSPEELQELARTHLHDLHRLGLLQEGVLGVVGIFVNLGVLTSESVPDLIVSSFPEPVLRALVTELYNTLDERPEGVEQLIRAIVDRMPQYPQLAGGPPYLRLEGGGPTSSSC